jgi:hypothetical protein
MLSERTKSYLRIRFEKELYNILSDTFYKDGLDSALFLLKEAPVILSGFANRHEKEFKDILLSEQKSGGFGGQPDCYPLP